MNNKIKWCFKLKDGLRIREPSERLSKSYLKQAKLSLERAHKTLNDEDLLWTTVIIYTLSIMHCMLFSKELV